jgi:DNA-binding SARP family transcriptional activator/tetratricopeptide (TPR) repeat protein
MRVPAQAHEPPSGRALWLTDHSLHGVRCGGVRVWRAIPWRPPPQCADCWGEVLVVDFGLLGPLIVRDGARHIVVSAPRQRVLLAALLLSAGRVVSVDALAEMLWEEQLPAGARGALHSAVQRLRSTLGPPGSGLVDTRPPGYLIQIGDGEFDVRQFAALAARGHAAAGAGLWAQASGLLREALGLWRGEPLADVPSQVLRAREVPHLEDQRMQALGLRIDADLHLGRHDEVVAELRQLVAVHPSREHLHAQLMLGLYRGGRQADALAAYQDVRRVLADELGVDPGPELRRLHQRILAADPGLLLAAGSQLSGSTPASPSPPATGAPSPAAPDGSGSAQEPVVPRQLPPATRHFVGRADALKALAGLAAEATEVSRAVVISAIDGTAGIGKTTLAVHFAHQVAGHFPDGQLYVNLRGFDPGEPPMTSLEAIRLFLDALAVPAARIPASLDAQAGLCRSLLADKRMLVLLDNARDVDQVRPLLPATPGCLVIVTSRSQLTSLVAAEGAYPLTLDVLTDAEARELLTRRLGPQRVASDPSATDELLQLCAWLPLALSIAAARAASRPTLSLASLTTDLRDAGGRLDALDAGHAAANVRAVFSWSYQQLDATAARVFRLLGLHAGPDIGADAAASMAGLPLREWRRGLSELTRAHLLAEQAPGRFAFHDLLRAYAAERAHSDDSEAERRAATHRMLDHYLYTAHSAAMLLHPTRRPVALAGLQPGVEPERLGDAEQAMTWFEAERRVLMAAAARALEAGFDTHAWQIPWALARFLDLRGYWHDWAVTEQTALAATERLGDRVAWAFAHQRFGFARARLGGYEDAHAHLGHALSIYGELGDRTGQANAHNALAMTLHYQDRNGEALGHARQALELFTAAGDPPGRALALNAVGWYHTRLGDHRQALNYCGQALDLLHALGYRQAEASTLDSLGYAHQHLGNHNEAVECYQRALDLHRGTGDRWGQAETLGHAGDAHYAAGHLRESRAAWEEALTILDDLHHPDARRVRAMLDELGADPPT